MLVSYFALLAVLATGCLAMNTRVLDGKPAAPHQFPYHVGIYTKLEISPISELKYEYGGAVISDKWVLTTADFKYMVGNGYDIIVKAGKHVVDQKEPNEQIRFVVRYISHPEYKAVMNSKRLIAQNDLGMLQVNSPFVFNEYVSAARLPSVSAYVEVGSLAGWGLTGMESYDPTFPEELHFDDYLPVISPKDCAEAINKTIPSPHVEISSNQTCTNKGKLGACLKDEGNALVSKEDDKYVVFGVVASTILPCGVVERPTVYTRVGAYTEWINEVMKSS